MSFWNKLKKEDSFVEDTQIFRLSQRIESLEHKFNLLQTDQANLRGRFNSQLKGISKEEVEVEKKIETINNDEHIAFG
jgi:hypothetical protein